MYKRLARIATLGVLLVTLILAAFVPNLRFNYNFESFFPIGDPDLDYYLTFREKFENDNDYLLLGLIHKPSVFDSAFLTNVDQLTTQIESLSLVEAVISLTNIKTPVISQAGYYEIPVVHPTLPKRLAQDSIRLFNHQSLSGSLISRDAKATCLVIKHRNMITKPDADTLVQQINHLLEGYNFQKVHLAGKAKAQGIYIGKMKTELVIFLGFSIILVIIFLFIAYESLWGIVVPLLVVLLGVVWILGIMGSFQKPIDILMVLLPTIMFVVGMSDVVHILTKYIEEIRNGNNKIKALHTTFKEVGLATFLTSLTTSVGFLTLLTASIRPIREFGLYTAIGVFCAYAVAFTLLPAILLFLQKPKISRNVRHRNHWLWFLRHGFSFVMRKRLTLLVLNILLIVLSLAGISLISINTYLIEDIPDSDPLKQDFLFFDREFGGSRPFEMTLSTKDTLQTVYDPEILRETEKVENFLVNEYRVNNLTSPNVVIKSLNQAVNGGVSSAYRLPENEKEWKRTTRYLRRIERSNSPQKITADQGKTGRISGKMADIGSAITLERTSKLNRFIQTQTDTSKVEFRLTGTSNLIDKNNMYLASNMFQGLGIAFAVIALISGFLFRSARMVLITLVPNIVPLLMVAAIMGYFGITLKLSTSIIFTIAFGIAVDDTIHFISKFRIELQKGRSLLYALKRTYLSTGKAIVVTTVILSGGFLILMLSSFGGTFYTGLLVSLTLLFAVLIDLTLLPTLIIFFFKPKTAVRINRRHIP